MRSIVIIILIFICSALTYANEINISTTTKNGNTTFYLQAGAFNLEKDAKQRQKELSALVSEPVEIKNLSDKKLYLIQIGPISDYLTARDLQNKLSQKISSKKSEQSENQHPYVTQPTPSESQIPPKETPPLGGKLWNLRNADVRAVIAEVSRVTGKNFVIDPRVQGKISIVSSTPMNNNELYQVFLSVLQVSGYAAIPSGAIIKIIPNIDAKTQSPDLLNGIKHPPRGDDMMVAVVPVHYVPSEQLVPVLRPLMPQWSSISAYAPSNMLILSGRANNIRSLADIIKQVDNSSANGIDIVHLRHSLAMDIAATLKDLVKTQPSMGGARTQLTIAADDRSNSLLVSGSKTDRIRLRMLILKLDRESSEGVNSNTQVVYLNYLRAEDLVPILAGIAQANFSGNVGTTIGTITRPILDSTNPASNLANNSNMQGSTSSSSSPYSTGSGSGGSSLTASGATANTSTTTTQNEGTTKPTVQIIAEPNTNSIILNAPASVIRTLKRVISQLDIKPAQLLIEALVAEINQSDINDLGIEWGSDQQTGKPESFTPGFAIINSSTKLDDFQAQIYALARENKANILSTPSVVVLDNRQAKILVGKQVSIASTTQPANAGGTTNNGVPFTTFDRVNVALHLYVRPQITRGNGIQLQIDQGNDTLDPPVVSPNTATPTFRISSIVTSVHVESGDVVVLGGLTQDSLGNENNRLPVLGDIPGVGRLFKRNINSREKRVLMVFIKPIILRNERDNMHMTSEKYNNVRQFELDWLKSQDAFVQSNNATVLPALKRAELPKPFNRPPLLVTK
ncbi:GspD family T2SS secretin variant LspD [Fluoribacter gormanii]|uniref:General secretion pathway protein D n=1 Tax=Fluoribacter gormanii TaxID=464 RepID=A0A377GI85_9GAMM|nr:GspD family T2SS secretin variant LspD [Fluoribacter gormanii]KTD03468.1 type II protein secretion LspD [Fluoribacter gormanii]MCW8443943.1 GspD family T2SS secretin variant LspD [Fluoribacter gormanii]MCW8469127.1 GspD family T2SS secretin variant LspD [Fluoribacter gormanii]SIQ47367.1 general secretion pathway protein D [Fluoribacter gormanii]STO24496.1 Pullulanase secretion envelope pulD [Fluoribacter gormanii]